MCRNIRTLHNFAPPATEQEIHDAALQYVRKISGSRKPSQANAAAFAEAIEEIAASTTRLLDRLEAHAAPRNREDEKAKAKERWRKRAARIAESESPL